MPTKISRLADVDARAELGDDVSVGPFCTVGPHVRIGDGTILDSHVAITGQTTIGARNRFFPNSVIGADPQDISYRQSDTRLIMGDDNIIREGVTINRGAEKEDHVTRIGRNNLLMANCHIAHNCHIHDHVILVNGVLLGGHVHVLDRAIISGNSIVHHFATVGTLAFIGGGSRVRQDVPPYMLASGSDKAAIQSINVVGMRRHGVNDESIAVIKRAHRRLFREHQSLESVYEQFHTDLDGVFPYELTTLLKFIELQRQGRFGRARDLRPDPAEESHSTETQQGRAA